MLIKTRLPMNRFFVKAIYLHLLFCLPTLLLLNAAHAQDGEELAKIIRTNFYKNVPKILAITSNNNPSIIVGPYGAGNKNRFTTNLKIMKDADNYVDFEKSNSPSYTFEVPYLQQPSQKLMYNFLKQLSLEIIAPLANGVETRFHENLQRSVWKIRQKIGTEYYNTEVTLKETKEGAVENYYLVKFIVVNKPANYKIRNGDPVIKRKLVSPGDLINLLSSGLNTRFKDLAMFAYETDSTLFKPYVQLQAFTDGIEENHTVYNSYAESLFKGRLSYETSKYFPGADVEAVKFFTKIAASIQPSFPTQPKIEKYQDGKSMNYIWQSDSLPFLVKLSYTAENGSFPQNVSFSFTSSKEEVDKFNFKKLQLAAEKGNAAAMNDVGVAYFNGVLVPKDLKIAAKYFIESAKKGNGNGMLNAGVVNVNGWGVKVNFKEGIKWNDKAAETKIPSVVYKAGLFFYYNDKIKKDIPKAMKFWKQAADSNHLPAIAELGTVYYRYYKDYPKALAYLHHAAGRGDGSSMLKIGEIMDQANNQDSAFYWYQKAASINYPTAFGYLADHYSKNKDYPKSLEALRKGAALENAYCMRRLGVLYEYGINGVEQNTATAKSWYQKAADLGDDTAKKYLKQLNEASRPPVYYEEYDY